LLRKSERFEGNDDMSLSRRSFLAGAGATTATLLSGEWQPPSNAANQSLSPLVFIPGIKGSVLSDAQNVVHWFTFSQALGLASPELRLPLKWHEQVQERDGLIATKVLSAVGWHGVYAPFLNWAARSGRRFRVFPYDWRRDNLESTDEFLKFLEKVSNENGGDRVQVAAHSMGGLITFVALNRRPELFQSVLFAGVPFGPSINFLEDMHAGTSNGLNKRILNPEVMFTLTSPYSLFPTDPNQSRLVDVSGSRIVHDWFSADDWARQKLGIFANPGAPGVTAEQWQHLRNALNRARQFKSLLVYKDLVRYPSITVLASDAHPTLWTAVRNGPRAVKGWDFVTAQKPSGDERVDFKGAMPPAGVPHSLVNSLQTHEDLLNDTAQVESILAELSRRERA
jgi:pimeloyl-ACP methyl ester carboxylesterase